MTPRRKKFILSLVALALVLCALWALRPPHDSSVPDPEYYGKKLSYWLQQTADGPTRGISSLCLDGVLRYRAAPLAGMAIHALGTNAVPMIWRELNATTATVQFRLTKLNGWLPFPIREHTTAEVRRDRAHDAMLLLGTNAAPLAFQLITWLNAGEPKVRDATQYLNELEQIAFPALRAALRSPDPVIRLRAAEILANAHAPWAMAVPVTVETLSQTHNPRSRLDALWTADRYGIPHHPPLFRALLQCTGDADPDIQSLAFTLLPELAVDDCHLYAYLHTAAAQTGDPILALAAGKILDETARRRAALRGHVPTPGIDELLSYRFSVERMIYN